MGPVSTGARAAKPPRSRESPRRRRGSGTLTSRDTTVWPPAGSCRTRGGRFRSPLPIARCDARLLPRQLAAARGGFGRAFRPAPIPLESEAAYHAARQARGGLGSAFRPAYSALRSEAAAQAAHHREMRLRAGPPAGPHLAGKRGCVPRGWPSSERLRLCLSACL